ncbi:MAG TPA: glycine cleavage system protein GcvH [Rikenellaceae bacterium]|mgnify:FL=1|nr:glycine cleavage system protein GcvH [Rikenellaceae bacterium]
MSKIVPGLLYSESHEWVKVDGRVAIIGVSDYAQNELGDITYVDMPQKGDEVQRGGELGALESVKTAADLYSPVSGTIVATNKQVEDDPSLINADPYTNWIVKVEMSDPKELDSLLSAAAYESTL